MRWHLDHPAPGTSCDPLNFIVEGWLIEEPGKPRVDQLEVWGNGIKLGETFQLGDRPDVSAAWKLPSGTRTGFSINCYLPTRPAPATLPIEIRAGSRRETALHTFATATVTLTSLDARTLPFGHVLDATFLPIVHREHVYQSGPSLAEGSAECLALCQKFLGPTPRHVLDVGCGLGYYGKHLRVAGHDWLGAEMKATDCVELARQGLPHVQVDGTTLPFPDGAFEAALSIEVLEHVEDPMAFLREVHRVSPQRLLISVPNFEPVCYLSQQAVVPWHLLESDHKNFFTRWSLQHLLAQFYPRVEVTGYHRMPLPSTGGTSLFYNLFASASA